MIPADWRHWFFSVICDLVWALGQHLTKVIRVNSYNSIFVFNQKFGLVFLFHGLYFVLVIIVSVSILVVLVENKKNCLSLKITTFQD